MSQQGQKTTFEKKKALVFLRRKRIDFRRRSIVRKIKTVLLHRPSNWICNKLKKLTMKKQSSPISEPYDKSIKRSSGIAQSTMIVENMVPLEIHVDEILILPHVPNKHLMWEFGQSQKLLLSTIFVEHWCNWKHFLERRFLMFQCRCAYFEKSHQTR